MDKHYLRELTHRNRRTQLIKLVSVDGERVDQTFLEKNDPNNTLKREGLLDRIFDAIDCEYLDMYEGNRDA